MQKKTNRKPYKSSREYTYHCPKCQTPFPIKEGEYPMCPNPKCGWMK